MGKLIRTLLVLIILVLAGAYLLGYMPQTATLFDSTPRSVTIKAPTAEEIRHGAATTAQRVDETLADAALTTKIKAKIALDDTLKQANVHISTSDSVVTISGTVSTTGMQERVLQLVRETAGVKSTLNELKVAP
jgi:hyperosmotically inducible periplasmic protein